MERKTATFADMYIGAHVYKGQGKTLYRVWAIAGLSASVVKATTERDPSRGCFYPFDRFTVEVESRG